MHPTKNTLDAAKRGKSVVLLGVGLVHGLDLERQAKQAHWNVRGPHFISLHELFDRVATQAATDSDTLAERLVALGGVADGRAQTVANRTTLPEYPIDATSGTQHVELLSQAIATYGALARDAIASATEWDDPGTADVFTQITRSLDQLLWMVEIHRSPAG